MKAYTTYHKEQMKKVHKIAVSLGLKGKNGIYIAKNGLVVDLTATATDRISVLAQKCGYAEKVK